MPSSHEDRLRELIAAQLNIEAETIQRDKSLSDLGADSLDAMELIMLIEEEFKDELGSGAIPDDEVDKIVTFGDVVTCLERNIARRLAG